MSSTTTLHKYYLTPAYGEWNEKLALAWHAGVLVRCIRVPNTGIANLFAVNSNCFFFFFVIPRIRIIFVEILENLFILFNFFFFLSIHVLQQSITVIDTYETVLNYNIQIQFKHHFKFLYIFSKSSWFIEFPLKIIQHEFIVFYDFTYFTYFTIFVLFSRLVLVMCQDSLPRLIHVNLVCVLDIVTTCHSLVL